MAARNTAAHLWVATPVAFLLPPAFPAAAAGGRRRPCDGGGGHPFRSPRGRRAAAAAAAAAVASSSPWRLLPRCGAPPPPPPGGADADGGDGGGGGGGGDGTPPDAPRTLAMARSLLGKGTKAAAQRALLLTRSLPPAAALEVLGAALDGSSNEFIRATAAVQLGQLWPPADPPGGLPPPPPPPPPPSAAAPDGPPEVAAQGPPSSSSSAAPPPPPPSVVPVMAAATARLTSLLATAPEVGVRSAAAAGLGYLPPTFPPATADGVPALLRSLVEDADWQVHFSALVSLGTLRAAGDAPAVVASYLAHPNDLLVQAAVGALGDMADPAALGALLRLVTAEDVMVRQRLADALGKFGAAAGAGAGGGGDAPPAVPPELAAALVTLGGDPSRAVREAAAYSANALGVPLGGKRDRLERTFRMDAAVDGGGDAGEGGAAAVDEGGGAGA